MRSDSGRWQLVIREAASSNRDAGVCTETSAKKPSSSNPGFSPEEVMKVIVAQPIGVGLRW